MYCFKKLHCYNQISIVVSQSWITLQKLAFISCLWLLEYFKTSFLRLTRNILLFNFIIAFWKWSGMMQPNIFGFDQSFWRPDNSKLHFIKTILSRSTVVIDVKLQIKCFYFDTIMYSINKYIKFWTKPQLIKKIK